MVALDWQLSKEDWNQAYCEIEITPIAWKSYIRSAKEIEKV